jgi:proprotein convertase subtilisin/kexin type 5
VPTDSFSVQTFDTYSEEGQLNFYFIDKKGTQLVIRSKCNYPCKDCDASNAEVCTECYSDSDLPFLQLGVCVKECATSRFYNAVTKQCDACDKTCLQCATTSSTCTKCGVEDYLYLNPVTSSCLKECPDGLLEDSSKNLCIPCNENCLTCEKKVDACTSCDPKGTWPYFFHDNCISQCEPAVSVLVEDRCVECHSSCKTCAGTPLNCTSC